MYVYVNCDEDESLCSYVKVAVPSDAPVAPAVGFTPPTVHVVPVCRDPGVMASAAEGELAVSVVAPSESPTNPSPVASTVTVMPASAAETASGGPPAFPVVHHVLVISASGTLLMLAA